MEATKTMPWKWPVATKDKRPVKVNNILSRVMKSEPELRNLVDISWIIFIHNYKHMMEVPLPVHLTQSTGLKMIMFFEFTDEYIISV